MPGLGTLRAFHTICHEQDFRQINGQVTLALATGEKPMCGKPYNQHRQMLNRHSRLKTQVFLFLDQPTDVWQIFDVQNLLATLSPSFTSPLNNPVQNNIVIFTKQRIEHS